MPDGGAYAAPGTGNAVQYQHPFHVGDPDVKYTELYVRQFIKVKGGWTNPPAGMKFMRVRALSPPMVGDQNVHPTAYQGHFWLDPTPGNPAILDGSIKFNSTNGISTDGLNTVIDKGNDTNTAFWMTQVGAPTSGAHAEADMFATRAASPGGDSEWLCVEARYRLNQTGFRGNQDTGIEEYWINGEIQASNSNQNMLRSYQEFALNSVAFETLLNSTPEANMEWYRDNIVIATERIGCQVGELFQEAPPTGVLAKVLRLIAEPTPGPMAVSLR
jgi:hypothetical protein